MKPVWGTGEVLGIVISTVDGGNVTTQLTQTIKVHPEPGKPDHFTTSVPPPPAGTPEVIWSIWPDYAPNVCAAWHVRRASLRLVVSFGWR